MVRMNLYWILKYTIQNQFEWPLRGQRVTIKVRIRRWWLCMYSTQNYMVIGADRALWVAILVRIGGYLMEKHASDYRRKVYPAIINLVSIIVGERGYSIIPF